MNKVKKRQEIFSEKLRVNFSVTDLEDLGVVIHAYFKRIIKEKQFAEAFYDETGGVPTKLPISIRLTIAVGLGIEMRVEDIGVSPCDDSFWTSKLLLDILSCDEYIDKSGIIGRKWFYKSFFRGNDEMHPNLTDFWREGIIRRRQSIKAIMSREEVELVCEWNIIVPFVYSPSFGYVPGKPMAVGTVLSFEPDITTVGTEVEFPEI